MELLLVTGNGHAGMAVNRDERAEDGWMEGKGASRREGWEIHWQGCRVIHQQTARGCATRIRVLRPVGRRQLTRVGLFLLRRVPTRNCLGCALSVSLQV